ncbi:sulfite exporter TauE/SafE family protein [Sneathiella chinensis]|uniref:Probable membrane transporter protein n=1 Tax=Sneathiella chinensis TaxID=349750 RepID=A0ABQ5U1U2_9PROT|nr:sulfite exporter TauE/SafE family protein [Sneathiella chinensis]GLQ06124.1 membrane protein [Sneathiella chinensis]
MLDQLLNDINLYHLTIICAALLCGAIVKGVSSFGLPTIAMPIMILVLPLPSAVSVLVVPLILSNLVQMSIAGDIKRSIKRHWNLYLPTLLSLPVGVYFLTSADTHLLTLVVGGVLTFVSLLELAGIQLKVLSRHETVFAPAIGIVSGIIGGMTTLFAIMPIFFLITLGLTKERFVSAVSVLLFSGSVVLAISLQRTAALGSLELVYGLIGMIPIYLGIKLGTHLRNYVNPDHFKKGVLSLLFLIGCSMIIRALV